MPAFDSIGKFISTNWEAIFSEVGRAMRSKADAFYPEIRRAFERDGVRWVSGMQGSISGPLVLGGAKSSAARLSSRQGASGLKGSFRYVVEGADLNSLTLRKYSTKRYAKTHELGTVGAGGTMPDIVPVTAKALAIPLEPAMTPAGVPRRPGPRDWEGLFVYSEPKGGFQDPNTVAYLARPDPSQEGELEFLYRLAARVAIPPRLGMRDRHQADAEKRQADIGRGARKALAA